MPVSSAGKLDAGKSCFSRIPVVKVQQAAVHFIVTHRTLLGYEVTQRHAKVIVDTRGRYRHVADNVRRG